MKTAKDEKTNSKRAHSKFVHFFINGGLSEERYEKILPSIREQNFVMLRWTSFLTFLLMGILFMLTFFSFIAGTLGMNRYAYFVMGAVALVVFSLCLMPSSKKHVSLMTYLFFAAVLSFSIVIGVVTNAKSRASTICVLTLALPLFIIDKPYRIGLLQIVSCLAFCVCSYQYKAYDVFLSDALNCLCILVIGLAISIAEQNSKFQDLWNRFIINEEHIRRIEEQKEQLAEERIAIMLSQIQPHFLYNALNSIGYLCETDPQAAKRAVDDFAAYLRGNLDSLKLTKPVPFEKELEHVKVYLSLEKMRFEDELNIEWEIAATDFLIPSLTLQPLVENAVKYGVGKKVGGGTVTIGSVEYPDRFEIFVKDDGVGYDSGALREDGKTHTGIENVRDRLTAMVGGSLTEESEVGKGTTAVITIWKEKK